MIPNYDKFLDITLRFWINQHKVDHHAQGTDEWLKGRRFTIGSSEHYDATNTKNSKRTLICNKLGLNPSIDHVNAITWGNVMESTTKQICEMYIGCNISESPGSIKLGNISCSPDGLSVVNLPDSLCGILEDYKNIEYRTEGKRPRYRQYTKIDVDQLHENIGKINKHKNYKIMLFEFKSPPTRCIKDDISSEKYARQVLIGMDVINIVSGGIFMEAAIESCTKEQHWFNKEYTDIYQGSDRYYDTPVKIIGIKYFFTDKDGSTEYHKYAFPSGTYNKDYTCKDGSIFYEQNDKVYRYGGEEEYTRDQVDQYIDDEIKALKPSGCMRWKVTKVNILLFPKYKNLSNRWKDECDELIKDIREFSKIKDKADMLVEIKKKYD